MSRRTDVFDARAFTIEFDRISNTLTSSCYLSKISDPTVPSANSEVSALWDTGATHSCISVITAQRLGLQPVGTISAMGAHGNRQVNTYLVNLWLPNQVCIEGLFVVEAILDTFNCLIGMDIINLGDFAISNQEQKTVFTFRMPSLQRFDFVREAQTEQ